MAAGLTIDELRAKLDEALGTFYQRPRTIVTVAPSDKIERRTHR